MTCQECLEQLFEESEGSSLNRQAIVHLTECEDCRALARELRANTAALRAMRDEVLPEVEIPARVIPALAGRGYGRPWYWAAAAAVLLVGMGAWQMQGPVQVAKQNSKTGVPPHAAAVLPEVAAVPRVEKVESPVVARNRHRGNAAGYVESTEPTSSDWVPDVKIRIPSGDDKVVIYWLVGESQEPAESKGETL